MRWLFWLGSLMSLGGLWWLFQGVDVLSGEAEGPALVGGAGLFLGGLVLMGWGLGGRDPGT